MTIPLPTWLPLGGLALSLAACDATPAPVGALDAATLDAAVDAATPDAVTLDESAATGPVVRAALVANPDNVVSAIATVHVENATTLTISSRSPSDASARTTTLAVTGADLTVPVLGLAPGATSAVTVTATDAKGRSVSADPLSVTTGAMPTDFPDFSVRDDGSTARDYLLLSLLQLGTDVSVAAIIDRTGRYQWYRRGGVPSTLGFDFRRAPNGHYTVYQSGASAYVEELDLTSTVLRRWTAAGPFGIDGHEFALDANDHALALVPGLHTDDTRYYNVAGAADTPVMDVTIVELDPQGNATPRWASWPSLDLSYTTADLFAPETDPLDALHPNALSVLPDGDYLLSLRHTDTVFRIDSSSGEIVWRLGGAHSDFTFVDDPLNGFSHQHYARRLDNGDIMMVDNGNLHVPPVSRVVEYRLDETARTATMVWQYEPSPDYYSTAAGSAERLANGNTLISWGYNGDVVEVDPAGEVLWSLHAAAMVYRALPVDQL